MEIQSAETTPRRSRNSAVYTSSGRAREVEQRERRRWPFSFPYSLLVSPKKIHRSRRDPRDAWLTPGVIGALSSVRKARADRTSFPFVA